MSITRILLFSFVFFGCNSQNEIKNKSTLDTLSLPILKAQPIIVEKIEYKFIDQSAPIQSGGSAANYYFLIADTSNNYYDLQAKMYRFSELFNQKVDTLGRYFNHKKKKIIIPESDPDEVFAGEYLQRRDPSETISIEHLDSYSQKAKTKKMALVMGVYESKVKADSAFYSLAKTVPNAYLLYANVYIGCLH